MWNFKYICKYIEPLIKSLLATTVLAAVENGPYPLLWWEILDFCRFLADQNAVQ